MYYVKCNAFYLRIVNCGNLNIFELSKEFKSISRLFTAPLNDSGIYIYIYIFVHGAI